MTNLYRNWLQFVFWVHVEQTETGSPMQSLTIMHLSGQSIHHLEVAEEYISVLYEKEAPMC